MVSTRLCIIRHGETDWNAEKRIQGQTDIALNATGRAQALAMASRAAHYPFTAIYSSDSSRARATAQAIADRIGFDVKPLPQLRERHFGLFQGATAREAKARYPAAYAKYKARDVDYDFQTGESLTALAQRAWDAVEWIVRHHQGETVAVVTHAGVLDVLHRKATGKPLHTARDFVIPNCALNWFRFDAQGWHLEAWDDHHHHLATVRLESAE